MELNNGKLEHGGDISVHNSNLCTCKSLRCLLHSKNESLSLLNCSSADIPDFHCGLKIIKEYKWTKI